MLINCPECNTQISSKVFSCPKCAYPLSSSNNLETREHKVQTVEQTGKKYKEHQLISALLSILGFIFVIFGATNNSTSMSIFGSFAFIFGIFYFIFAKILTWWHHG